MTLIYMMQVVVAADPSLLDLPTTPVSLVALVDGLQYLHDLLLMLAQPLSC